MGGSESKRLRSEAITSSKSIENTASPSSHMLVAAIDFGTTYSGYAFSFKYEYERDPLMISSPNWIAASNAFVFQKTSTCVLFDPNEDFNSFSFEAEDKYTSLSLQQQQNGWRFFRQFKMELYDNKDLNRSFNIRDDQGQSMAAIKVFTAVIEYLKNDMCTSLKKKVKNINDSDILWVLTVPAIWSDASKQFMREAAEAAGIEKKQLRIALEPEAASLYCKYLPLERKGEGGLKTFNAGSKYLVLDAGGGTVDITAHEVQRDGSLKEIHKANGGDWGGTKVDHAFQVLLSEIIGESAFQSFMESNKAEMIEFFLNFELKKRTIKPNASSDETINLRFPYALNKACKNENGIDIAAFVESKQQFKGNISVFGDKLNIRVDRAKELFGDPVEHTVAHLKTLLKEPCTREVKTILMVGGFSESLVLQDAIKANFPDLRVIIPQDAGLAVLKGAVIFGHEPRAIKSRVCKYTYGVDITRPFNAKKHDPIHRLITADGEVRCNNLFSTHVRVGQCVDIGQPQSVRNYTTIVATQTSMLFKVYASTEENPMYVTDPGCTKIGQMRIAMPDTTKGRKRSVDVQMTFSSTELEVEATDKETGEKVTAAFDFL